MTKTSLSILEAKLKDSEAERIRDRDMFEERMREMQEENLASQRRAEKIAQEVADLTQFCLKSSVQHKWTQKNNKILLQQLLPEIQNRCKCSRRRTTRNPPFPPKEGQIM